MRRLKADCAELRRSAAREKLRESASARASPPPSKDRLASAKHATAKPDDFIHHGRALIGAPPVDDHARGLGSQDDPNPCRD